MADGTITVGTVNANDGATVTADIPSPISDSYVGTVNSNVAVITVPEADLVDATNVNVSLTLTDGANTDTDSIMIDISAPTAYFVFDQAASEASFEVRELVGGNATDASGAIVTDLSGDGDYRIVMLWQDTDGFYAGDSSLPIIPVTSNQGSVGFVERIAGTNFNLYQFSPSNPSSDTTVTFEWGRYEQAAQTSFIQASVTRNLLTATSGSTFDHNAPGGTWIWQKVTNKTNTSNNDGHRVAQYSSVNAFNADKTLFYLPVYNGGVFDINTLNEDYPNIPFAARGGVIGGTTGLSGTAFWDKNDPFKMYGIKENESRLISIDIRTPTVETLIYDAGNTSANIAGRTGRPDDNQTYVTIDVGNDVRVIRLSDGALIRTQTAVGTLDFSSVSPLGDHFAINSSGDIRFYSIATGALVSTSTDSNHGDFVLDDDGTTQYFGTVGNPPKRFNIVTGGSFINEGSTNNFGHKCGTVQGKQYLSNDSAGVPGPWELSVGGIWENADLMGSLPAHIAPTFAASQMKVTVDPTGEYALAVVSNPQNVPNTYLGRKTYP